MSESGGFIGRRMPRADARRLAEGKGRYTDDLDVANVGHVAFLRSPHAHARIVAIDTAAAKQRPGVVALVTGDDLAAICKPWQARLAPFPVHRSPPQHPLARGEACWQGEAVAAVVAQTRAQAEDAIEAIAVDWEELPAIPDLATASAPGMPAANSAKSDNLGIDDSFAADRMV